MPVACAFLDSSDGSIAPAATVPKQQSTRRYMSVPAQQCGIKITSEMRMSRTQAKQPTHLSIQYLRAAKYNAHAHKSSRSPQLLC
jgi:hypothetical protein